MIHFRFSDHAVEQFIARYNPALSFDKALTLLKKATATNVKKIVGNNNEQGSVQWHLPDLGVMLLTKPTKTGYFVKTTVQDHRFHSMRVQQYIDNLTEESHRHTHFEDFSPSLFNQARFLLEVEFDMDKETYEAMVAWLEKSLYGYLSKMRIRDAGVKVLKIRQLR